MLKRAGVFAVYAALIAGVAAVCSFLLLSFVVDRAPEEEVPQIVGIGLSESLDRLAAQRLDLEVRGFEYSDDVPENHVIRQKPEAGRIIRAGRSVGVVLSRGAERHPVPAVAGLGLEDARISLEESGLKAVVSDRVPGGPVGEVIAQGVEAGTRLLKGKAVALLVSSGPRPILLRMPNLMGLPVDRALLQLDSAGLPPGRVEEVPAADPSQQGLVTGQDPLSGYPVPKGTAVSLVVGARPPERPKDEQGTAAEGMKAEGGGPRDMGKNEGGRMKDEKRRE